MHRLTRRTSGRHCAADRPGAVMASGRAAEVFVAAVSGLSALVDDAWLADVRAPGAPAPTT